MKSHSTSMVLYGVISLYNMFAWNFMVGLGIFLLIAIAYWGGVLIERKIKEDENN